MVVAETMRLCRSCNRDLPIDHFYASGHGNGRRWTCRRCMADQASRERRQRGARQRPQRINQRGHVWCSRCQRYLPAEDFKRHPTRSGVFWSYCRPCTREIDRERYARRTSTIEGAERELAKTNTRKRKRRRRETRDRQRFVAESILLLRRRGLTKSEISRLAEVTLGNLLRWERQEVICTPAIAERMAILVRETAHLPIAKEPAYRRRLPHPEMPSLMARCIPQIRRYPVRTRWGKQGDA